MDYQMDAMDQKIVRLLQQDGKMKLKEIASSLKMTSTPVFERIRKLEQHGIIKGYSAQVDLKKMGFSIVAFCSVTLERHHTENLIAFEKAIKEIPEIVECYHIAGLFDYLLKIVARDMEDYQRFVTFELANLQNIGRVQSSFVMTELKKVDVLPD